MFEQFPPTRTEALARLTAFVPHAGRDYASRRNFDIAEDGSAGVSGLSPYIRHRLLHETEVLSAVLGRHSAAAAEKYVQEVFWRTYWKGWLEMRPGVWAAYKQGLQRALNRVLSEGGLRQEWEAACRGETGIDAFDHWALQLADTGYMHNHARMWFASIWIFTLRLPWELGADFFLRHLLDGDPASNTLSWRWVGGLQTAGKTYLARPDNIHRYSHGRFRPTGLAAHAPPLPFAGTPSPVAPPQSTPVPIEGRFGLILHEDDLSLRSLSETPDAAQVTFILNTTAGRSPFAVSPQVHAFTKGAFHDTLDRLGAKGGDVVHVASVAEIPELVERHGLTRVATAHAPVGPAAEALTELAWALQSTQTELIRVVDPYDTASWPYATKGFFKFKEKIPTLLRKVLTQEPDDGTVETLFSRSAAR